MIVSGSFVDLLRPALMKAWHSQFATRLAVIDDDLTELQDLYDISDLSINEATMPSFNPKLPADWEHALIKKKNQPEFVVNRLLGYRAWKVRAGRLASISMGTIWDGPVMRADKKPTFHSSFTAWTEKQHESAAHGIYVLNLNYVPSYINGFEAYGLVSMVGKVVEHVDPKDNTTPWGYRTEALTIESLCLVGPVRNSPKVFEDIYEVDVQRVPDFQTFRKEILSSWKSESQSE